MKKIIFLWDKIDCGVPRFGIIVIHDLFRDIIHIFVCAADQKCLYKLM